MKRRLRRLTVILLLAPAIALAWLTTTESGLHWAYQQSKAYLPGELTLTKLEGRLIGPITVTGLEYRQDDALIKADQITLEWRPAALLAANIHIDQLHVQALTIVLPPPVQREQPLTLPQLHLPWRVALKDLSVNGLSVSQLDQTFALQQLKLKATTLFSQIEIEALSIKGDTFKLNLDGTLKSTQHYRHALAMHWQTELPSKVVIDGRGQLEGDIKKTLLEQHLSGPFQLTFEAEFNDLLDQFNWQGKVDVDAFDTSKLQLDLPPVSGKLTLAGSGDLTTATLTGAAQGSTPEIGSFDTGFAMQRLSDNTIQIDRLTLHSPVNDTRLRARGQWLPGAEGGDLKLAFDWQNLRWPLMKDAWFDSAIGSGWISGTVNRYQLGLATDHPWPEAPPSTWYASADGNLDELTIHSLRVNALNGEASATGRLSWSPQLTWQAEVNAAAIDPASIWPQWPGEIDAILSSNGRIENDQLLVETDVTTLSGTLRGYPISLSSRINWNDAGFDIHHFDFHSGTSQVSARGHIGETLKLDWLITATDLAELYPLAHGQLQAKGQLSGPQVSPQINASVKGTALSLSDYEVGQIEGDVALDLFSWQQVDIRLAAQSLSLKGYLLSSLNIDADAHQLELKAVSDAVTVLIELKGAANPQGWRGRLTRADIQSRQFANWQLTAPTGIDVSAKTLAADRLCWDNNEGASLCTTVQNEAGRWQANLDIEKLPLMLASRWLPPEMKLEGVANATAEVRFQPPEQLLGHAHIQLPPGTVSYPLLEGERDRWEYREGKVEITLDEQGLESSARIALTNGDRFSGRFALPGVNLLTLERQQQLLQADAQLSIHDLGLIQTMIPEVQDLRGEVAINLTAAGTLSQPKISGQGDLLNGSLRIPRLGLTIDQLSLKSQSKGVDTLTFRLDARSGDGDLAIQGQTTLDSVAGWPTAITIKGNEFEASRIPEARVLVSPDLQVKLQQRTIEIKGDIHIPYARLQPKDITTAARVSSDTVIVSGEQASEKWLISTRVRMTLGERVNFYGFGFEGRFEGSLLLEDEPGQLTTATGELSIPEGRYRAYGQRLDVEQGRLFYTGGPIANPGLDLRSVRRVDNVTAGLKVRGSLSQPQIELFSIPAMGETDALSYLLLGRPIENASGEEGAMMAKATLALGLSGGERLARILGERFGLDEMRIESSDGGDQASLVMGRYLSPRLYISYGVGIIESVNTFSLRYKISDQWQLKGESGEHQGADLLYTIER